MTVKLFEVNNFKLKGSPTEAIWMEVLLQCYHAWIIYSLLTSDAAEQTQAGSRVASVATGMTFCRSRWHGDCHSDRLVELPPPGLHGDDGAKGGSVPKDRSHHVIWHRLGLNTNTGRRRERLDVCLVIKLWEMFKLFLNFLWNERVQAWGRI